MNIYENLKLMREDQLLLLKKINRLVVNLMSKKQKLTLRGVTYEFDLSLDKNIKYMIFGEYQRDVVELCIVSKRILRVSMLLTYGLIDL